MSARRDEPGLAFGDDRGAGEPPRPADDAPLADRVRPRTLDEVVGQDDAVGPGSFLRTSVARGEVPSVVLWGPPGSGKTTIARALAGTGGAAFEALSAVTSGVKDVRAVVEAAEERRRRGGRTTLFVDEIHRFHRGQQDAFLPHVEAGTIALVGATTENPAFALTPALLSRLRVVVLSPLSDEALETVLSRGLDETARSPTGPVVLGEGSRAALLAVAGGDARRLLNALEGAAAVAASRGRGPVTPDDVRAGAQRRLPAYDRGGDAAYDLLSAFHKSLRGSDADAALYWMARMLEAGEDPLVPVRRMVAMACEDVGLADRDALRVALEAKEAVQFLGLPEGELAMVRAVIHLATAPKSNAVVKALGAAREAAKAHPDEPVPLHLRNAPTGLSKSLGHGEGYVYAHDRPDAAVPHAHLPEALGDLRLYVPAEVGDERETARRLAWWRSVRERARRDAGAAT
jgi:putative ATPase